MAAAQPTLETLEARRAVACRLTPAHALATLEEAEAFLLERGLLTLTPDCALPSLFGACHEEPYAPGARGFGTWPRTKWPWHAALAARPGVLLVKLHRGKSLYLSPALVAIVDPLCREALARAEQGDSGADAAHLLKHLAASGPTLAEDVLEQLGWERARLRALRDQLERLGMVVSRSVSLANGARRSAAKQRTRPLGSGGRASAASSSACGPGGAAAGGGARRRAGPAARTAPVVFLARRPAAHRAIARRRATLAACARLGSPSIEHAQGPSTCQAQPSDAFPQMAQPGAHAPPHLATAPAPGSAAPRGSAQWPSAVALVLFQPAQTLIAPPQIKNIIQALKQRQRFHHQRSPALWLAVLPKKTAQIAEFYRLRCRVAQLPRQRQRSLIACPRLCQPPRPIVQHRQAMHFVPLGCWVAQLPRQRQRSLIACPRL